MRYEEIELAINEPSYEKEYETWNKYFDGIANKEYVESKGYFWAVTKADFIEGSAVAMGSNFATPTLSQKSEEDDDIYRKEDDLENVDSKDDEELKETDSDPISLEQPTHQIKNERDLEKSIFQKLNIK
jgi:hypothetical protein